MIFCLFLLSAIEKMYESSAWKWITMAIAVNAALFSSMTFHFSLHIIAWLQFIAFHWLLLIVLFYLSFTFFVFTFGSLLYFQNKIFFSFSCFISLECVNYAYRLHLIAPKTINLIPVHSAWLSTLLIYYFVFCVSFTYDYFIYPQQGY